MRKAGRWLIQNSSKHLLLFPFQSTLDHHEGDHYPISQLQSMSGLLCKLEAIQSRIASYSTAYSYSCPRGVPGRVHAIRLQRCFQNNHRQPSRAFAAIEQQPEQNVSEEESLLQIEHEHEVDQTLEQSGGAIPAIWDSILEKAQAQTQAHPDIVRTVPYPSVALEGRLRILAIRSERRHRKRGMVPGEHGEAPPILFTAVGDYLDTLLLKALRKDDPHIVLATLGKLISHDGFTQTNKLIQNMPAAIFSELLHCLDPKHFVGRYHELHRGISTKMGQVLRLPPVDPHGYYKFCDLFLDQVNGIFAERHRSRPLTLADFKYLLKCARATGNGLVAKAVWDNLVSGKGKSSVVPDLECYNHYLSVLCWADAKNPILRYRLRIVAWNFAPRSWNVPPRPVSGHRVGRGGIKAKVSSIFREMVRKNITGNEETFCHLIIAFAREGDLQSVASILQRVWGINVDLLMDSDKAELPPKAYPKDSPLHPSEQLLYSIAHTYGINNQIPVALRLVDYISRQYTIPIPRNVWRELLQWAYVLSLKRSPKYFEDGTVDEGQIVGQLPPQAISNLWDTMTSEPYKVKPTIDMYDRLIQNLLVRQCYGQAQIYMNEARELYKSDVDELSERLRLINMTYPHADNPVLDQQKRDLDFLQLKSRRDRQLLRRWVRQLLVRGQVSLKRAFEWQFRGIPNIIRQWSLFLPYRITYRLDSGVVDFWTSTVAENRHRQWEYREQQRKLMEQISDERPVGEMYRTSSAPSWGRPLDITEELPTHPRGTPEADEELPAWGRAPEEDCEAPTSSTSPSS
ncbi:hypothetical protein LSUE1_G003159 [Lachnellula suecica]|uniref:ATPase expression protein 2, mitochondrial n=1 Tax=Lachnellula suecica TaxID=602035 RepID=A0A8T9CER2_9HELO|nr:hypothetical protein LSUE1_G003159 [Lachnellula suecica]